MSLEQKIEALTVAVNTLTAALQVKSGVGALPLPAAPVAVAPVAPAMPGFVMPVAPVAPMAPMASAVPFNDPKSLLGYVMESYKTMGPAKGAQIQTVLMQLGVGNINDVQPAQYAALHAAIEQLKAAA